jgi:glucuronosyltransferase
VFQGDEFYYTLTIKIQIKIVQFCTSPSHFIFDKVLAEGLAARGHNVTMVTPDVDKKVFPNLHYIHLSEVYAHYYK